MSTIMVYPRLSDAEKKMEVDRVANTVKAWFEQNPKRRVCRMDFFGHAEVSIKRRDVPDQVSRLADKYL